MPASGNQCHNRTRAADLSGSISPSMNCPIIEQEWAAPLESDLGKAVWRWPSPDDDLNFSPLPKACGVYAIFGAYYLTEWGSTLTYIGSSEQLSIRLNVLHHDRIEDTRRLFPMVVRRFFLCPKTEAYRLERDLIRRLKPFLNGCFRHDCHRLRCWLN